MGSLWEKLFVHSLSLAKSNTEIASDKIVKEKVFNEQ